MEDLPVTISRQAGIHVRSVRERRGLTRRELAEAAGVSERLIASLELGDATGIRLDKLLCICDAVGLSLFMRQVEPKEAPIAVGKPRSKPPKPPQSASYEEHLQYFLENFAINPREGTGEQPWQ